MPTRLTFCRRAVLHEPFFFSIARLHCYYSTRGGRVPKPAISRKERRLRQRLADKEARKQQTKTNIPTSFLTRSRPSIRWPTRIPIVHRYSKEEWLAIAERLPIYLFACAVCIYTTPFSVHMLAGPSMLPTIATTGDIWLIYSPPWMAFARGDLVVWSDASHPTKASCKRIVGMPGDSVQRNGQYVHLYRQSPNLGISRRDNDSALRPSNDIYERLVVPPKHVWLEGDFPPLSLDSRQLGPIPIEYIRGKLIARLWPFWRTDHHDQQPRRLSPKQPLDLDDTESLAQNYNLHKLNSRHEERYTSS